jgi:hypothetical protein
MLSEATAGDAQQSSRAQAFWFRLTDNLFRRLGWYLVPVILMTLLGYMQANKTVELYRATGVLSASSNPLVPSQEISGVNSQFWESAADTTSRIINEQLRTDNFLSDVVEEAGLRPQVDAGLLDLGVVRASVWASPNGDSILSVNAEWNDPQISYALVNATIAAYQGYIAATAASDATQAEAFWAQQIDLVTRDRDEAEVALTEYLNALPPLAEDEDRPPAVQIESSRLQRRLDTLDARLDSAQARLDEATLTRVQQTSEAVRSLNVVDPPQIPTSPVSTFMKRVTLVASFMVLGGVIALAALLVTTVLDRSVSSPADLITLSGISLVATVPPVRMAGAFPGRRTLLRSGRSRSPARRDSRR